MHHDKRMKSIFISMFWLNLSCMLTLITHRWWRWHCRRPRRARGITPLIFLRRRRLQTQRSFVIASERLPRLLRVRDAMTWKANMITIIPEEEKVVEHEEGNLMGSPADLPVKVGLQVQVGSPVALLVKAGLQIPVDSPEALLMKLGLQVKVDSPEALLVKVGLQVKVDSPGVSLVRVGLKAGFLEPSAQYIIPMQI